jgi:hypothetical protein
VGEVSHAVIMCPQGVDADDHGDLRVSGAASNRTGATKVQWQGQLRSGNKDGGWGSSLQRVRRTADKEGAREPGSQRWCWSKRTRSALLSDVT